MTASIPRAPHDITPRWLSEALGADVRGVRVTDIGAGTGLFGIVLRLHLDHDGGAPDSLVAKLPTAAEANLAIGNALGIYEREVRFYRELASSVPVRVPRCHFGAHDELGSVLLLEDIVDLTVGDQVAGISVEQAETVVDALADLHARFWESPDLDDMAWLPRLDAPVYAATVPGIYHSGWPVLRAQFGDTIGPDAVALGDRLDPLFEDVMARCATGPDTVIHTDSRLDNLFFAPEGGTGFALIDWQLMIRGRGVSDVAYLIGTSLAPELQAGSVDALVERYHARLVERGVSGYSLQQCWHDYREHSLYYIVGACSLMGFDTGNERGQALTDAYVARMFANALGCDAVSVL